MCISLTSMKSTPHPVLGPLQDAIGGGNACDVVKKVTAKHVLGLLGLKLWLDTDWIRTHGLGVRGA